MPRGRVGTVVLALVCALAVGCTGGSDPAATEATDSPESDYWPTREWRTAPPEEHGLDPEELEFLDETLTDDYPTLRSLVIVRNGFLLHEYYGRSADGPRLGAQDGHDVRSVTKSVVSMLVGIALADGHIESVDQTVAELLPGHLPARSALADVTLTQLLTMTSGLEGDDPVLGGNEAVFDAMWNSPDWVRHILGRPLESEPGTAFAYSSATSHLLSAIVAEATGRPTLEFARERLFGPLGISTDDAFEPVLGGGPEQEALDRYARSPVAWPVDPQGYAFGGSYLRLPARDLAKLGQLYLSEGRWEDEQLVPADYVRDSTTPWVDETGAPGDYGWHWWVDDARGHDAYFARGYGGQVVHVVPDLDLVTVVTADPEALIPASTVGLVAEVVVPAAAD